MQGSASGADASAQVPPGTDPGPGGTQPPVSRRRPYIAPSSRSPAVPTSVGSGKIVWQLDHSCSVDGVSVCNVSEKLDLSAVVAADADGPFDPSDVLECESYDVTTDGDEEKRSHQAPQHDPATSPDDIVSNSPTLLGELEDHLKAFSASLVGHLGPQFDVAGSEPSSDDDDFQNAPFKRREQKKQVPL